MPDSRFRVRFPLMLVGTFVVLAVTEGVTAAKQADMTWAVSAGFTGAIGAVIAYALLSRWLTIGFHVVWNTAQAGVFGVRSSGQDGSGHSLYQTTLSGQEWLTGGSFGPEASVVTLVVVSVPALILLVVAAATGRMRRAAPDPVPSTERGSSPVFSRGGAS
jgi:hypothetical protein